MDPAPPGPPPPPHPVARPRKRANRDAFLVAGAMGAAVWLICFIASPLRADHNSAFVAGDAMATAFLASVPVAIAAWASATRWPLWRYVALIAVIAVGLTVVKTVNDRLEPDRVSDGGTAAAPAGSPETEPTHERRTAAAPPTVGAWTRDDSTAAQAQAQTALDQWRNRAGGDGDTAELALYWNGGQQATLFVITARPGSRMDEDTSRPPAQSVVDALAGAGVEERSMLDPGPWDGALGCGPSTTLDRLQVCAWVELGMLGTVSFVDTDLTPEAAGAITRDFRQATER
jgi:hypothetical protein